MNTAAFWLALLGALPQLLTFLAALADQAKAAKARGEGYDQAVKDGLVRSADGLKAAIDATNAAAARHQAHPDDDSAFIQEARRD